MCTDLKSDTHQRHGCLGAAHGTRRIRSVGFREINVGGTVTRRHLAEHLRGSDWFEHLRDEFEKNYWLGLEATLDRERRSSTEIFPPEDLTFEALRTTSCTDTKVVILGQDPYARPDQAHGLAFSVPRDVPIPGSLRNIHRELSTDWGCPIPAHGDLGRWAREEGVLLLNSALTVRAGLPGSHLSIGWERFTDAAMQAVADQSRPVFILWGRRAQSKGTRLALPMESTIYGSHPSPRSAWRGFFGSKPFSRANELLQQTGRHSIDWTLDA